MPSYAVDVIGIHAINRHWDAINRHPNAYATKVVVPPQKLPFPSFLAKFKYHLGVHSDVSLKSQIQCAII
jgi:hypothetical protein